MNEFLKNLRSGQKDRSQGSARGSYDSSYPHPDRRTGPDRRKTPQKRISYQTTDELLQGIGDVLLGIQGLLQGMGEATLRMADARERLAESEERKVAMLEKLIPLCQDFLERTPSRPLPDLAREAHGEEAAMPIPKKVSPEERKSIVQRIRAMRKEGATYDQIAEYLEKNQVPTFSNKGQWHAPTIHRLCRTS